MSGQLESLRPQRRLLSRGLAGMLAIATSAWLWLALLSAVHILPKH